LSVTPFSKSDVDQMDELLNARHLLVHHGGIYTLKYARERGLMKTPRGGVFFDSIGFDKVSYVKWETFLIKSAKKLVEVSIPAVNKYVSESRVVLVYPSDDALERLSWGINDNA
jgi:hypothetical protein